MDELSQHKVIVFQCGCGLFGINPASFLLNPDCPLAYAERLLRFKGVRNAQGTCKRCGEPVRIGKVWKDTFLNARQDYLEQHPDMAQRIERVQTHALKERGKIIKLIMREIVGERG